jgi:hypothetical protein
VLGASATSLGIIEGVAEGVNSLLKVSLGWLATGRRRRDRCILGYPISSVRRPLIALTLAGSRCCWSARSIARGRASAARRATRCSPASPIVVARAASSAFHRAMDHTGAIIGPLVATVFLFFLPGQYRTLFLLTAIPGAIAVAMLFFVKEPEAAPQPRTQRRHSRTPSCRTLPTRLYCCSGSCCSSASATPPTRFCCCALSDALGLRHVHPAAVGRAPRRQGVALDLGRRTVGSSRPPLCHRPRLGDLRRRLHRLRAGDQRPARL